MTQISVARALTKLKTTKAKINVKIKHIAANAYGNSKTTSILSKVTNVEGNRKETTSQITATIQSYKDLMKYYRAVSLAIQDSNSKTMIHTDAFGDISVADAIIITTKLNDSIKDFSSALNTCIVKSTESAENFNKKSFSKTITESMDKSTADALLAQPCVYFNPAEAEAANVMALYIHGELNALINESNAITMIDVPDEVN